jgi:hypothetical protein
VRSRLRRAAASSRCHAGSVAWSAIGKGGRPPSLGGAEGTRKGAVEIRDVHGTVPDLREFDRVVPPSGNLMVCRRQFWLGPARSGITVTFWADSDVIHLLIAGARIKSVRSHLSATDLAALLRQGGRPAGPPPLPPAETSAAPRRLLHCPPWTDVRHASVR